MSPTSRGAVLLARLASRPSTLNGRDAVTEEIVGNGVRAGGGAAELHYAATACCWLRSIAAEARAAQPFWSYLVRVRAMPLLDIASPVSTRR
jgi:hypothetical protein